MAQSAEIGGKLAPEWVARAGHFESGVGKGERLLRRAIVAGFGLAGLVFGGLPYLAARRILYPVNAQPLPHGLDELRLENGIPAEYVEFEARDSGRLSGWFVQAPADSDHPAACVLLVYGYGGYKEQMIGYAQMMHNSGFATFMADMQGSGLRRGAPVTLGYKERWDLMDAVRYVRSRPDVDPERIGVLGISMGAATALLAAEEDQSIKVIVADSSYANLTDMIQPGLRAFVGAPAAMLAPLIVRYAETMLGMRSSDVRPEEAAAKLGNRPLFIIHGADDSLTNPESAQRIYDAASGPKELWVVPECGHSLGPVVSPEEYRRRIADFIWAAFGGRRNSAN
ncbi:MAG: alpha/beta hydrolase [Chloroflexota bacterium]